MGAILSRNACNQRDRGCQCVSQSHHRPNTTSTQLVRNHSNGYTAVRARVTLSYWAQPIRRSNYRILRRTELRAPEPDMCPLERAATMSRETTPSSARLDGVGVAGVYACTINSVRHGNDGFVGIDWARDR
jgi:hypothetical protein